MKIAFCNEVFGKTPLEEQFACIAEAGYDGVELAPFSLDKAWVSGEEKTTDVRRLTLKDRDYIRQLAEKNGLAVSGLHWLLAQTGGFHLTSPDKETRARTAAYFKELVRFGADVGGSYLVLGSPVQRNILPECTREDAMKNAAEVLSEIVPALAETNQILGLEPLAPVETNFLNTGRQAAELLKMMGMPKELTVHLDCKAMADGEDRPIPDVIRDPELIPLEKTFHANDPNKKGPGFGNLDFGPILAALKETGFSGWIGVEPFDYSDGPAVLAKNSLQYMKSNM